MWVNKLFKTCKVNYKIGDSFEAQKLGTICRLTRAISDKKVVNKVTPITTDLNFYVHLLKNVVETLNATK